MLKSLGSGISGMKVNQQKLDVVANNIANSETTAFKSSSTMFQDLLSQSISGAQGGTAKLGGVNGSQIGLGVKLSGITIDQTQGSMNATGATTNVAIDGDGYFMVEDGPIMNASDTATATAGTINPGILVNNAASGDHSIDSATLTTSGAKLYYTRDGSFSVDSTGNLVNSNGLRVLGYSVSTDGGTTPSISDAALNTANFVDATGGTSAAPTTVTADDTVLKSLIIPSTVMNGTTELNVTKISIDSKGLITATLSDSSQTALGQIAMASFSNPSGLKDIGSNLNESTTNSGIAITGTGTGTAGTDNSKAFGSINSGYVEASNVDITKEFTEMITTTRAFQANGKTITNADTILQTIINLKQ